MGPVGDQTRLLLPCLGRELGIVLVAVAREALNNRVLEKVGF